MTTGTHRRARHDCQLWPARHPVLRALRDLGAVLPDICAVLFAAVALAAVFTRTGLGPILLLFAMSLVCLVWAWSETGSDDDDGGFR